MINYIFLRYSFSFLFSFFITIYLIPKIIQAAIKMNIVDVPDGKLKLHEKTTPYLGGVAIYISFIATLALVYPFENKILWFLLGITLLLFVGLIDDLKVLKPYQKFLGQIIAVVCFLKNGFYLKTNFFSDNWNYFFSAFWMLSVINAMNLVDVMDGLATLIAIIAAISFFIISIILKEYSIGLLMLAFLGPMFGFFIYNKPKAKIYLGDAGSLFLGGFLAAVPLLFPWSSISWNSYYTAIVILAVPILELGFLVIIRTIKKIPFYHGSPHHFAIYLQKRGLSPKKILLIIGLFACSFSLIALLFLIQKISLLGLVLNLIILVLIWIFYIYLREPSR